MSSDEPPFMISSPAINHTTSVDAAPPVERIKEAEASDNDDDQELDTIDATAGAKRTKYWTDDESTSLKTLVEVQDFTKSSDTVWKAVAAGLVEKSFPERSMHACRARWHKLEEDSKAPDNRVKRGDARPKPSASTSQVPPTRSTGRRIFDSGEREALQRLMSKTQRPTMEQKQDLADELGRSISQITNWFSNNRPYYKDGTALPATPRLRLRSSFKRRTERSVNDDAESPDDTSPGGKKLRFGISDLGLALPARASVKRTTESAGAKCPRSLAAAPEPQQSAQRPAIQDVDLEHYYLSKIRELNEDNTKLDTTRKLLMQKESGLKAESDLIGQKQLELKEEAKVIESKRQACMDEVQDSRVKIEKNMARKQLFEVIVRDIRKPME